VEPSRVGFKVPDWLSEAIDRLEAAPTLLLESEIAGVFRAAIDGRGDISSEERRVWWCEVAAFWFGSSRGEKVGPTGRHFRPQSSLTRGDGSVVYVPDPSEIGEQVISYWENRAGTSRNPVARARYADLVWDLRRKATGTAADVVLQEALFSDLVGVSSFTHSSITSAPESPGSAPRSACTWVASAA